MDYCGSGELYVAEYSSCFGGVCGIPGTNLTCLDSIQTSQGFFCNIDNIRGGSYE